MKNNEEKWHDYFCAAFTGFIARGHTGHEAAELAAEAVDEVARSRRMMEKELERRGREALRTGV